MTTPVLRADQGKLRRLHRLLPVLLLALFTGAVGLVALQARPSNRLVRYVSPPMDTTGMRVSVLVPAGWRVEEFQKNALTTGRKGQARVSTLVLSSPSLPHWLRWGGSRQGPTDDLTLYVFYPSTRKARHGPPEDRDQVGEIDAQPDGAHYWVAEKSTLQPPCNVWLLYRRSDRAAFDWTERAIRDSLTLLPGPEDG